MANTQVLTYSYSSSHSTDSDCDCEDCCFSNLEKYQDFHDDDCDCNECVTIAHLEMERDLALSQGRELSSEDIFYLKNGYYNIDQEEAKGRLDQYGEPSIQQRVSKKIADILKIDPESFWKDKRQWH